MKKYNDVPDLPHLKCRWAFWNIATDGALVFAKVAPSKGFQTCYGRDFIFTIRELCFAAEEIGKVYEIWEQDTPPILQVITSEPKEKDSDGFPIYPREIIEDPRKWVEANFKERWFQEVFDEAYRKRLENRFFRIRYTLKSWANYPSNALPYFDEHGTDEVLSAAEELAYLLIDMQGEPIDEKTKERRKLEQHLRSFRNMEKEAIGATAKEAIWQVIEQIESKLKNL